MITLYQFTPEGGLPNPSPFCIKVETYLRMTQLPFEVVRNSNKNLMKSPKGKLPFIEDKGEIIADSTFIIEYLKRTYGNPLDATLSEQQQAVALAFQRLFEENLYWTSVYSRWINPQGWAFTSKSYFGGMPIPLRWIVPPLARRGIKKSLHGHGIGRHSEDDVMAIGVRDVTAVAQFLSDKQFFMGDEPTSIDAVVYGFLATLNASKLDSPVTLCARSFLPIAAYCERMKSRFF